MKVLLAVDFRDGSSFNYYECELCHKRSRKKSDIENHEIDEIAEHRAEINEHHKDEYYAEMADQRKREREESE